jgi:NAD(P)-dependent dehydrogenase (short-subunit alcohol dehydrogenase family)
MSERLQDRWTEADVPGQTGRVAVVTGASAGIGFETARVLAARGAHVVLACRDEARAEQAADRITGRVPDASLSTVRCDLASLASVRKAAAELADRTPAIDLLINNAGVMMIPYGRTEDGFEQQFAVNHLGPFALTGLLLPGLLRGSGSRVVTVSSLNHRNGQIEFDDLQSEGRYRPDGAYAQSKLANLLFSYELQRRLDAAGAPTIATAAHPGLSRTELFRYLSPAARAQFVLIERPLAQSAAMGALPTLRAATDPGVQGGDYFGPARWAGLRGYPRLVASNAASHDAAVQQRLWQESERLTGVSYAI